MSAPHISLSFLPSLCQKFSQSVEIWQSSDRNNSAQFFETGCSKTGAAMTDGRQSFKTAARHTLLRWRSTSLFPIA